MLRSRSGATVYLGPEVVTKIHAPGTDGAGLRRRLQLAADTDGLLSPLSCEPGEITNQDGTRWTSAWPRIEPLRATQPDEVPWDELGRLIAQLHLQTPGDGAVGWSAVDWSAVDWSAVPECGARARLARVCAGLEDLTSQSGSAAATSIAASDRAWLVDLAHDLAREADAWVATAACTLVHGDLHLGQFGRLPDGSLLLIDVDDLGFGPPAWDLGRFAAALATGRIDPPSWERLATTYCAALDAAPSASDSPCSADSHRSAGGGLWPAVDLAARCSVLIATYGLLRDDAADALEPGDDALLHDLVATCARIAGR